MSAERDARMLAEMRAVFAALRHAPAGPAKDRALVRRELFTSVHNRATLLRADRDAGRPATSPGGRSA